MRLDHNMTSPFASQKAVDWQKVWKNKEAIKFPKLQKDFSPIMKTKAYLTSLGFKLCNVFAASLFGHSTIMTIMGLLGAANSQGQMLTWKKKLGVVHKLRWQDLCFFWPPTPLCWHILWYERWQKVHCNPVQGQYRARTGFSLCTFPCEKKYTGNPCFHYRDGFAVWTKI